MSGLEESDREAAAHAVAPRVRLADIENAIVARFDTTADQAMRHAIWSSKGDVEVPPILDTLKLLSICILVMSNGFTVIGKSAPASSENFDAEFGKKLAYEDAIRQLWPLMGFALRDRLAGL